MLACYWGPGIQAFIVRDPDALTNFKIVLACWFDVREQLRQLLWAGRPHLSETNAGRTYEASLEGRREYRPLLNLIQTFRP